MRMSEPFSFSELSEVASGSEARPLAPSRCSNPVGRSYITTVLFLRFANCPAFSNA